MSITTMEESPNSIDKSKATYGTKHWPFQVVPPLLMLCVLFATDNGDGDTDVLGASSGEADVTWWENTSGNGSTWTEHIVDEGFNGAQSVFATDVDGDGDTDVLGAAINHTKIFWWENI